MNGNDTETIVKASADPAYQGEKLVMGASMRSWITLLIVEATCIMSIWEIQVREPLYGALLLTLGFYFGQKK